MVKPIDFEEFTENKIQVLQSSSFYGGRALTESEIHRVEVLEQHLQEYRDKKREGLLDR